MKRIIKKINDFRSNDVWEIYNDFLIISAEKLRKLSEENFNITYNINNHIWRKYDSAIINKKMWHKENGK